MSMREIEADQFAMKRANLPCPKTIRVASWNINRGVYLRKIIAYLADVSADLILLQEADVYARRTDYRNIPREIARALHFEEVSQGLFNSPAYHGQATLSRFQILCPHILKFRRQSSFWRPRFFVPSLTCFQRRIGARMALICEIAGLEKKLVVYNVHLESRGNNKLRISQLSDILMNSCSYAPEAQILIAGDFNSDILREPAATLCSKKFVNYFASSSRQPTVSLVILGKVHRSIGYSRRLRFP